MAAKVKVRLLLGLARFNTAAEEECVISFPDHSTVQSVLDYFGIPETEPVIIMKNGYSADLGDVLVADDALVLVPSLAGG